MHRLSSSKWLLVALVLALVAPQAACSDDPVDTPDPGPDVTADAGPDATGPDATEPDVGEPDGSDTGDPDSGEPEPCEVEYVLPPGASYALSITRVTEPSSIAALINQYASSVPPILLFADGLSDGLADDPVSLVGGIGARVSFGFDDTPDTEDDVYALDRRSISTTTCGFAFDLLGASTDRELSSQAAYIEIDLGGFSSATAGVSLRVDSVDFRATFDEPLDHLAPISLSGELSDEGVDQLLEAVRDLIPLSREQAMRLLDPDGDGVIPVEMQLSGRRVVVEGFLEEVNEEKPDPREEDECCPEGAQIGDPFYGFVTWQDQGLQDDERELFQLALPALRANPEVALIATADRDGETGEILYYVYSGGAVPEGELVYRRVPGTDGGLQSFEIVSLAGENPLASVDPTRLSTYEAFLSAATNPNSVDYSHRGYLQTDPRVGFVPVDQMNYPFAYERIAQNFDDPRAGDLIVLPASYATGGFGNHGHLGSLQSRSPLFISGPGIRSAADAPDHGASVHPLLDGPEALLLDDAVRIVDIAPTIAAALGVARTTGIGPDGRFRDDVLLKWQDGRVLEEVFTADALERIGRGEPVAERAIVIVNDGLTNIEILMQALSDRPEYNVDAYARLLGRGLAYRYGSITNFPSNTYPSHNSLGAGVWAGHHGIVDNGFWAREKASPVHPIRDVFETEYLFGSANPKMPIETLHEAVIRTYGTLDDGNLTASINDPSTRGAQLATLERRLPEGFAMPSQADVVRFGGEEYPLPLADITDYAGVMDNGSLQTLAELFMHHRTDSEAGLPVPRYTIVNFGSTDSAGHAHGPHGDQVRDVVISRVNDRLRILFELLDYLDLWDTTLIVLTSDHGMELQDTTRHFNAASAIEPSGVHFRSEGGYVYFKQLDVHITTSGVAAGGRGEFTLEVYDRDTRWGEETVGVADVSVRVVSGGTLVAAEEAAFSDADGRVTVEIDIDADATDVLLEFVAEGWNPHRVRMSVP